jgi:CheY-like chemotaxis protein
VRSPEGPVPHSRGAGREDPLRSTFAWLSWLTRHPAAAIAPPSAASLSLVAVGPMILNMTGPSVSLPPPAPSRDEAPIHVLVVDDDEAPAPPRSPGCSPRAAIRVDVGVDGPAALDSSWRRTIPTCSSSIVQMPGMTGIELCRSLKARIHPSLEVVIMTGLRRRRRGGRGGAGRGVPVSGQAVAAPPTRSP